MRGCCNAPRTTSWKDVGAGGAKGTDSGQAARAGLPASKAAADDPKPALQGPVKGPPPPEEPATERIFAGAYAPETRQQEADVVVTLEAEGLAALDLLLSDDSPPAAAAASHSAGSLLGGDSLPGHGTPAAPAAPEEEAAAAGDAPQRLSAAGSPLLRAMSGGRRSTSTAASGEEREASKRFSATGSAAPALDTIREASSSQSQLARTSADSDGTVQVAEWAPRPASRAGGTQIEGTELVAGGEHGPGGSCTADAQPFGAAGSSPSAAAASEPVAGLLASVEALLAGGGCAAATSDGAGTASSALRDRCPSAEGAPLLAGVLELLHGGNGCVEEQQQQTAAAGAAPSGLSADSMPAPAAAAVISSATAVPAAASFEPSECRAARSACCTADLEADLDAAVTALLGPAAPQAPAAEAGPCLGAGVAAAVAALLGGDLAALVPARAALEVAPGQPTSVAASSGATTQAEEEADSVDDEEEAGGHVGNTAHPHGSWGPPSDSSVGSEVSLDDTPAAAVERSLPAPAATWGAVAAANNARPQHAQPHRPSAPPPAAWQWDGSEAREPAAGGLAMYARGLREREEAEARYALLRRQREQQELDSCTFRPVLRRPAGSGARPSGAPSGSGGGSNGGGTSLYERGLAQRQHTQHRYDCLRQERESAEKQSCTFAPAVSPRSTALFAAGVRYGGSGARVRGIISTHGSMPTGMGASVIQELEALHRAGLDAAAAAAILSASLPGGGSAGTASHATAPQDSNAAAAQPAGEHSVPASEDSRRRESACLAGTTAGVLLPHGLRPASGAAGSPAPRQAREPQGSPLEALAGAALPPALISSPAAALRCTAPGAAGEHTDAAAAAAEASPVKAFDRLYAHACDLRERQRQAALRKEHQRQQEALAASPKPLPFPRAQHSCGASPPLSRRSPPPSRPASATPASRAASAAAAHLGRKGATALQAPAGPEEPLDFESFLQRQAKFVQVLEGKLERERQLSVLAQHASLSPGTQRILQRRQAARQHRTEAAPQGQDAAVGERAAQEEHGSSASRASFTIAAARGVRVQLISGQVGVLPLPRGGGDASGGTGDASADGSRAVAGAAGGTEHERESGAGTVVFLGDSEVMCSAHSSLATHGSAAPLQHARSPTPNAFPFRPTISERAAARPGRSPAELHAEWEKRQQKLELKRRLAEEAAVAACTFAPDISPAASPGGKLAATRPRINMQDLDGYLADLQRRRETKEAAATAAAHAREERELAACTFQPNLATAPPRKPPRTPAPPPPTVLEQVQALLESGVAGGSHTQAEAGVQQTAFCPPSGGKQASRAPAAPPEAAQAVEPALVPAFDAYLGRVARELERLDKAA